MNTKALAHPLTREQEKARREIMQAFRRKSDKADVLKVETLNVRGMARNHHLALSVADAGMSRLVTFCEYKADWRGRKVEKIDRWFPGSQTCCLCGARHREMRNVSVSRRNRSSSTRRSRGRVIP
jgi:transposase